VVAVKFKLMTFFGWEQGSALFQTLAIRECFLRGPEWIIVYIFLNSLLKQMNDLSFKFTDWKEISEPNRLR